MRNSSQLQTDHIVITKRSGISRRLPKLKQMFKDHRVKSHSMFIKLPSSCIYDLFKTCSIYLCHYNPAFNGMVRQKKEEMK